LLESVDLVGANEAHRANLGEAPHIVDDAGRGVHLTPQRIEHGDVLTRRQRRLDSCDHQGER
jgi:hypothetical protein